MDRDRPMAIGMAAAINIAALCVLVWNAAPIGAQSTSVSIATTLFEAPNAERAPPSMPSLQSPEPPREVQPPQIEIAADSSPSVAASTAAMAQMLAPRPDPQHINAPPAPPKSLGAAVANIAIILQILVEPDGSIADARITKSSGDGRLDKFAMAYVKANWRFIPALISGTPIEDWTTVLVPIRA
jgi:TonB family protein